MRRVIRHLRHRRILTRKKFLGFAIIINLIFLFIIGINLLSFPNTIVGHTNLGLRTKNSIREYLTKSYASTLQLTVNAQTYDLSYEHIGIYMDPQMAIGEIFAPNAAPWPDKLRLFVSQIVHPRQVRVPLSLSQEFYEYVDKLNDAGSVVGDIVYIDQDNKQATLFVPHQRYRVNLSQFQAALLAHFGDGDEPLIVPLTEVPNALEGKIDTANQKLANVYNSPLTIIAGLNGRNEFITLSPQDLRRYTTVHIATDSGAVDIILNTQKFLPDLTTALAAYKASFNPQAAYERVGNGIKNALTTSYEGGPAESVKVGIDSGPNTDGEVADKYIEIDLSQQKLFTFRSGKLLKQYRVSTGKDYPTPVGKFTILNKTGLGYSAIYNVYMPYWMGFEFSKELGAYFGIHELPYFYSGTKKIQLPREFIGAPNTGGCVALDIGDAKEVYQLANLGTPVVIYQ